MCFFNPSIFFSVLTVSFSAPILILTTMYVVGVFLRLRLFYFKLLSEVWIIFFVRVELKKFQRVSKPLHPSDKKFSASDCGKRSYFPAASFIHTMLELQISFPSFSAPDAQESKLVAQNLKLCGCL